MPSDEKETQIVDNLPTNIEQITPEFVAENLSAWEKKISKMLAALDASQSSNRSKEESFYIVEAKERARQEGGSLESVLDSYRDELRKSTYPTAECLFPDEVVQYLREQYLPDSRLKHAEGCKPCTALLLAALPAQGSRANEPYTVSALDDLLVQGPVKTASHQSSQGQLRKFFGDIKPIVRGWLILVAPAMGILLLARSFLSFVDRGATSQTMPANDWFWVVAFVGSFLCLIAFRGFESVPRARLMVSGGVLALVCLLFFGLDYRKGRATTAMAFDWARSKTELLALAAIDQKQATDSFPNKKQASQLLNSGEKDTRRSNVEITESTKDNATYVVTVPEVGGTIKAELRSDGGELIVDDGKKVVKKFELLLGTVKDDARSPVEKLLIGDGRTFIMPDNGFVLPSGTRAVAIIDPDNRSIEQYQVLSRKSPSREHLL